MGECGFSIALAGIPIRFSSPVPITPQPEFVPFVVQDQPARVCYHIELYHKPLVLPGKPVFSGDGMEVYATQDGWLRIYPIQQGDGLWQVACFLRKNGDHSLLYPAQMADAFLGEHFRCLNFMGLDWVLAQFGAILLHSSLVTHKGKAVLFSGPSGAGKSTQADLWCQTLGADLLNGDRSILRQQDGVFYAFGAPYAGSSRVYRSESAPIGGIAVVSHGKTDTLQRLGVSAFRLLYEQTLLNSWDPDFMAAAAELLARLIESVPVYALRCLPQASAVELLRQAIFD